MVLDFYGLQEQPFGVTPDSRYLFLNSTYKEALSSIIYAIESGCGFVSLIAAPGMGKTTLLFRAQEMLREKSRVVVFLFQTMSTPLDLLRALLSGLGVRELNGSLVEMQIRLKDLLHQHARQGKHVVLVIDEAQNLDDSVLELVRMLSNLETPKEKLIQIILAGQPQLAETIGSPELLQLRQRISIFARLKPFTPDEVSQYVASRLKVAGYASTMPLFTKDALALIAQWSDGIPRNINNLCFNAISLGCALQQKPIDRELLRQVIADLDLAPLKKPGLALTHPEVKTTATIVAEPAQEPGEEQKWPAKAAALFADTRAKAAAAIVAAILAGAGLVGGYQWLSHPAASQGEAAGQPAAAPEQAAAASQSSPSAVVQPPSNAVVPPANSGGTSPASAGPAASIPAAAAPPAPNSAGGGELVTVGPGQTLAGICIKKFGVWTPEMLRQIRALNPALGDLDHIEIGQSIRLPNFPGPASAGAATSH
jgi:type II secretory pathway predicted ATPase ExeA